MKRCGWLRRWWHARLRRIDRQIMLRSIIKQARDLEQTQKAWALFRESEGQEHWRCGCAPIDGGPDDGEEGEGSRS